MLSTCQLDHSAANIFYSRVIEYMEAGFIETLLVICLAFAFIQIEQRVTRKPEATVGLLQNEKNLLYLQ